MKSKSTLFFDMGILFLVSYAAIVYEVFLPRFFSIILDYNFVFLVISLATLGIGLGGYATFYWKDKWAGLKDRIMGLYAFSIVMVVYVMYVLPFQGVWFYALFALMPFFFGGWLISGIMQEHYREVNRLYFFDLLGAGLGAVGSIFLMNELNPVRTISLLSFLLFTAYFLYRFRRTHYGINFVNGLIVVLLLINVFRPFVELLDFKAYQTSPNTAFYNEPGVNIVFSEWNAFTRTDVYDANDDELLYITIDGGAVSPISRYSGNLKDVDYLRSTTSFLAFEAKPHQSALIIGAGGGQEVLTAQIAGYANIEAVDINQASFRAVQETKNFSGDLFNQANVQSIVSDGRNYIRNTPNQYDLIYLSLVTKKSENGVGLSLTENYIYTQEAIKEYLDKLTDRGRLAFLLHDEKELTKIMFSAIEVLKEQGISAKDVKNHIAMIGTYQHLGHVVWGMNNSDITRPLIIIQNQPFSRETAENLFTSSNQTQQIPIHIPYIYDQFQPLTLIMQAGAVNVDANRDDRPFFYHQTNQIPQNLLLVLLIAMIAALILTKKSRVLWEHALYFSGLALGFILIEVTLIQRLILPLGHPTLAFVLVLGVLLVSGGIGSLFSANFDLTERRYIPLLMVGILTIGVHFFIIWLNENSYLFTEAEKLWAVGLVLVPLGFFMGMPFPFGLSKAGPHQLGASWGLNGLMTVSGSVLAVIISLTLGFSAAMLFGAAIYGFLFALYPILKIG